MVIKEFFQDYAEMCSSSNTTSRGFYIAMAVIAIVALIGALVGFVFAAIGKLHGTAAIIGFAGLPVVLVLVIAVAVWLHKQ